jgi:hypothetical protein
LVFSLWLRHLGQRLLFIAVLFGLPLVATQVVVSQDFLPVLPHQERGDTDREGAGKPASKQNIAGATERLRRSVNGRAMVRNVCQSKGSDVQVEERTEITQTSGCDLVVKTRKTTSLPDGQQEVEFTLYVHLADLTTPSSVEPQSFSQCKTPQGAVLKVMSRAQPGKVLRATRRSNSIPAAGSNKPESSKPEEPEAATTRSDLSFFFSDPANAARAARALERAVKVCGGKEWPDEDDLP